MLKITLLLLASSLGFAEAPKISVVQATTVTCSFVTALAGCRPAVVVNVESKDANEKFLVGIRYLTKDGVETIESRYPVSGAVWFYFGDDVTMLSATAGSLKTNEVAIWSRN